MKGGQRHSITEMDSKGNGMLHFPIKVASRQGLKLSFAMLQHTLQFLLM